MREGDAAIRAPSAADMSGSRAPHLRLLGVLRLFHPFPSILNALVVAVLAGVAARGWPGTGRILTLTATMLCIQCAIGALNDWADRGLDALTKPAKPIPAGLIGPKAALAAAVCLGVAPTVLAARFGGAAWALAMMGFGVGIAYDLGLKRTPFSALTYAVALPLVPVWVWTALDLASPAVAVVLPVGFLLGFGLQLANALPDAEGDALGGVRGTLQYLGPELGRRVAWLSFGAALALAALLAGASGLRPWPFLACWVISAVLLLAAVWIYRRRPSRRSLQVGWTLLAPAAGALAVGWLGSLPG
jgi:4-hydroxybenzoate polyprenyltransferase